MPVLHIAMESSIHDTPQILYEGEKPMTDFENKFIVQKTEKSLPLVAKTVESYCEFELYW